MRQIIIDDTIHYVWDNVADKIRALEAENARLEQELLEEKKQTAATIADRIGGTQLETKNALLIEELEEACENRSQLFQENARLRKERDFHIKSVAHHIEKARAEIERLKQREAELMEALQDALIPKHGGE